MKLKEKPFNITVIVAYTSTLEITEEIGKFYNTLKNARSKLSWGSGQPKFKVWKEQDSKIVDKYEFGSCNECMENGSTNAQSISNNQHLVSRIQDACGYTDYTATSEKK